MLPEWAKIWSGVRKVCLRCAVLGIKTAGWVGHIWLVHQPKGSFLKPSRAFLYYPYFLPCPIVLEPMGLRDVAACVKPFVVWRYGFCSRVEKKFILLGGHSDD